MHSFVHSIMSMAHYRRGIANEGNDVFSAQAQDAGLGL
jgi:hypothetical protein